MSRFAVITGAIHGVGRAIVLEWARNAWAIYVLGRGLRRGEIVCQIASNFREEVQSPLYTTEPHRWTQKNTLKTDSFAVVYFDIIDV